MKLLLFANGINLQLILVLGKRMQSFAKDSAPAILAKLAGEL